MRRLSETQIIELYTRFSEFQVEAHSVVIPRTLITIATSIRELRNKEWQKLCALLDFITSTSPGFPDPRVLNSFYQYGAYGMANDLYYWLFEGTAKPVWFEQMVKGYELPLFLQDLK
jgi:hypothetical protein